MSLVDLKNRIVADGKVDVAEVQQLKDVILADGAVDREEAQLLFDINNTTSGNCSEWQEFFVSALTNHVLADDASQGTIDAEESEFLIENIFKDGNVDQNEKALLANLKDRASTVDASLQNKFTELQI